MADAPLDPAKDPKMKAFIAGAQRTKIKAWVNLDGCTGCEACISACPVPNCIVKFGGHPTNESGVYIDYSLCIGCKKCVKDCPWDTIWMIQREATEGHKTSLDTQTSTDHSVFENPEWIREDYRTFKDNAPVAPPPTVG